jgi:hypothetical protein
VARTKLKPRRQSRTQQGKFVVLERPNRESLDVPQAPRTRRSTPLLAPNLLAALSELAATEDLPVATLVALLINEALDQRLHRRRL